MFYFRVCRNSLVKEKLRTKCTVNKAWQQNDMSQYLCNCAAVPRMCYEDLGMFVNNTLWPAVCSYGRIGVKSLAQQ